MKKIVAINGSPRGNGNTAQLIKEAALGAKGQNAEVKVIDLYKLKKIHRLCVLFRLYVTTKPGQMYL